MTPCFALSPRRQRRASLTAYCPRDGALSIFSPSVCQGHGWWAVGGGRRAEGGGRCGFWPTLAQAALEIARGV